MATFHYQKFGAKRDWQIESRVLSSITIIRIVCGATDNPFLSLKYLTRFAVELTVSITSLFRLVLV